MKSSKLFVEGLVDKGDVLAPLYAKLAKGEEMEKISRLWQLVQVQ